MKPDKSRTTLSHSLFTSTEEEEPDLFATPTKPPPTKQPPRETDDLFGDLDSPGTYKLNRAFVNVHNFSFVGPMTLIL